MGFRDLIGDFGIILSDDLIGDFGINPSASDDLIGDFGIIIDDDDLIGDLGTCTILTWLLIGSGGKIFLSFLGVISPKVFLGWTRFNPGFIGDDLLILILVWVLILEVLEDNLNGIMWFSCSNSVTKPLLILKRS